MNEKTEFGQRLRSAMIQAGYEARPAVLEREFNTRYWGRPITFQAVRAWLRGEAIPSQDKLQVLAEWLKIEPQILRFGERVLDVVSRNQKLWDTELGYLEREVIEVLLALPVPQRKVLREVILTFAKAYPPHDLPDCSLAKECAVHKE